MTMPLLALALLLQAPSPGASYWQQGVRYDIRARLDERAGVLSGTQGVVYVNRSPDTLSTFSFHLYLNAFRPGSRWADADSVERRRRFNDLKDPDYAFNHVRNVRIMGAPVTPIFPFAPDSTIVRFQLPLRLRPGDSMEVTLEWDARPSTTPRRQGREGRRFDFAQWYPKVVVYDRHGWQEHPVYPGGEFYGEFATFLVELDLPEDQVMGATGVPLCGDPGWERANQVPDRPIQYQRDYYPNAPQYRSVLKECVPASDTTLRDVAGRFGRKSVVWYAEDVHHFAMSLNPAYRYEGGKWGDVAIHVLYQPGDEQSWGRGVAVTRTAKALEWLDGFYGKFAWPQITNVHRIEGGGTEFPMMIHDGSASQGLIVHELGHNYTMGILANNEWREGWLDEGFTSFQNSLFDEAMQPGRDTYAESEPFLTGLDLDGQSEPASLVSEDYRDFTSYNIAIYSRGEQFFHQLRYLVGDRTLHQIMRTYYDRWKLKHVDEESFRSVAEEVSGMDLSGFFAQGLHTTALVDYAVGRVRTAKDGAGWATRVEVIRRGEGRLPVEVWVIGDRDTAMVRSEGLAEREWVTVLSRSKPKQVLLDPRVRTRDWNMLNNSWRRGWLFPSREPKREYYLDTWLSERSARDRRTQGIMPVAWFNDAGGVTVGVRSRENYFDRFDQNTILYSYGTGWQSRGAIKTKDSDFFLRFRNPTALRAPGLSTSLEAYNIEGRYGAALAVSREERAHLGWGPVRTLRLSLTWLQPDDFRYLDRGYYEDAGTVELALSGGVSDRRDGWELGTRVSAAGGLAYNRQGLTVATGRGSLDPFYGRFTFEATMRRSAPAKFRLGARLFGGLSTSGNDPVKQRQIYAAGADPIEQFASPFLRSTGALFVRSDVYYHMAGGGNLRGFDPRLSSQGLVAVNVELERTLAARPRAKLFRRVAIATFGDAGEVFADGGRTRFLVDAGVGLRAEHRLGGTSFTTRADFPIFVNRPAIAADTHPGSAKAGFRWTFGFSPAF